MIFTNARLIFPDGIRDGLDIVVEEKKIAAIHPPTPRLRRIGERLREEEVIDLNGNYLAPGFIDLHVHGALGRDTMDASPEAFRAICDFHASGGTTSLLLTTTTAPIDKIVEPARYIREHDVEPVAGVAPEPFLHLIGDHPGGADKCQTAIAAGDLRQLADRQIAAPGAFDDPFAAALAGVTLRNIG